MKRQFQGLHQAEPTTAREVPDGLFLVRVRRAQYRAHPQKPYYLLCFTISEPIEFSGKTLSGCLYCTQKALWKLTWVLRDFGYDLDLLGRDEIDDKNLIGLGGIIKVSHSVVRGAWRTNLDGFAPASQWEELSPLTSRPANVPGVAV